MDDKTPTFHCKAADIKINMAQCLMMSQKELSFWGPDAAKYNKGCPCPNREEALMARKNCKECGRTIYQGSMCAACRKAEKEKAEEEAKGMDNAVTVKTIRQEDDRTQAAPDAGYSIKHEAKSHKRRVARCAVCGKPSLIKGQGMCGVCYYQKVEKPKKEAAQAGKIMPVKELTTNAVALPTTELKENRHPAFRSYDDLTATQGEQKSFEDRCFNRFDKLTKKDMAQSQALITLAFQDEIDMKIYSFIEAEAKRTRRTPDQQALWMLQSHLPESRAAVFYKAHGDQNEHKAHGSQNGINPGPL